MEWCRRQAASLAGTHDLIDESRLMVFPIVLVSGMRLFDETADATILNLVDTHPLGNGVVILTYHPARGRDV
jgi:dihydrofolate reductase